MADISKLEQQADLLFNNVAGWESSTLQRIGKRIGKYGKLSLADVKSINNIAIVKSDMDAITKELAKVTGYNISQIEQMYGELLEEQHLANQPLYDYRGKTFVPFKDNKELQAIARAYAKTTGETMINLAKTSMLRTRNDKGRFVNMQKGYVEILDRAVMQVTSGATDFHTAMRESIIQLGGGGVQVEYASGVSRRLDTVVRQNLLWGAKQASIEYNELIGQELGCDGYEVDAHSSPRPSHMFVQGKQYCIGKSRTINGIKFIGFEETDPTSPDGKSASQALGEYGCLHYKTPILCGISEPRFSKEQLAQIEADNQKQYKVGNLEGNKYFFSQKMRSLESAIREQKDIKAVAQASGNNALVKRCNERIKAYHGKYDEISNITGIQGDKKRMSVPRSTATVKDTTPTPKNVEMIKKDIEEKLVSNGCGKVTAGKIQEDINALQGNERIAWENGIKKTRYEFDAKGGMEHVDFGETVHLAKGYENTTEFFHETAHAIDDGYSLRLQKVLDTKKITEDVKNMADVIGAPIRISKSGEHYRFDLSSGEVAEKFNDYFSKTFGREEYRFADTREFSDIVSALTLDKSKGSVTFGGHSGDYWTAIVDEGTALKTNKEIWADYCALRARKETKVLELLNNFAPNTSRELSKLYDEIFTK